MSKKFGKVRRTSKPNLEPPEPSVCLQKPNLEPTEPQNTEPNLEPNQVRPNTILYYKIKMDILGIFLSNKSPFCESCIVRWRSPKHENGF